MGRRLEGNLPRAHEVQGTARLLVQQCIDQIKFNGGWGSANRQIALRDGTVVKAIVLQNIRGMQPIVRVEIFAPKGTEKEKPVPHIPGIVAFIPASGPMPQYTESLNLGFGIGAGIYLNTARRTYASPYVLFPGTQDEEKINGLLGTEYSTTIVGREGDHRERKPAECGWLADWDKATGEWTATRGHTGYFGMQNWIGKATEAEQKAEKPRKDVLSWDGPRSRYGVPSSFGIAARGGRVYHRLRILCDLLHPDYKPDDIYSDVSTVGAAIHHTSDGTYLYQVAYSLNVPLRVFRWTIVSSGSEDEKDEFDDRYTISQEGPPDLIASIDLQSPFRSPQVMWEMKTGVFFNESGTSAVCTIGTTHMSGSDGDRTYLVHYSVGGGTTFELVWDSTNLEKDEGRTTFPILLGADDPVYAGDLATIRPYGDSRCFIYASGSGDLSQSKVDNSTYKLRSFTQIIAADYVGDSLVFMYYTNPETIVTQYAYSSWAGSDYQETFPVGSTKFLEGLTIPNGINCDLNKWDSGTRIDVKVGDRAFFSSNGSIRWEGGACESKIYMDGQEEGFLNAIATYGYARKNCSMRVPPMESYLGMTPCEAVDAGIKLYLNLVGTGWAYNNLAVCRGEAKNYNIDYLDMRFGLMALQEKTVEESANVDWRANAFDLLEAGVSLDELQTFHYKTTEAFLVVDGSTVLERLEYSNEESDHPIGLEASNLGWGRASGSGLDYWWRMNELYIPHAWAPELSSTMNQWWDSPAKIWCAPIAPRPPSVGNASMLRVNGDLIYSIPYAYEGVDSLTSPIFYQKSVWGGDSNPQKTFFEIGGDGAPPQFYLANLSLI
jgi:hypothetical protein